MPLIYFDPVSGRNRLKRRYSWGLGGFALGLCLGLILAWLF
jgi:hypothetical protein